MKHLYKIFLIGFLVFGIFSCELPENVDPKDPTEVQSKMLFLNAQGNLIDYVSSINQNLNNSRLLAQYAAQTTYTDESRYNFLDRQFNDALWNLLYHNVLYDLKEARTLLQEETGAYTQSQIDNRMAAIDVLEVYTYHVLVDQFGDVPYNEALQGAENPTPAYDDGQEIYEDLISRLSSDVSAFNTSADTWGSYDWFYGGNTQSWITFANSLKFRLAMRLADVSNQAQTWAEDAVTAGVFSDGEGVHFAYPGTTPNTWTIWEEMIEGGRKDFVPANTIVNKMAERHDPRLDYFLDKRFFAEFPTDDDGNIIGNDTIKTSDPYLFYFNDGSQEFITPDSITDADGDKISAIVLDQATYGGLEPEYYKGGRYGDGNVYRVTASDFDEALLQPDYTFTLIDYVEMEFLLAEAVERGYNVTGTAQSHYDNAIGASIRNWGGTDDEVTDYLARSDVDYTAAPGTWKEKIGTQKYIALFDRGVEAWAEWRRLDYPQFNPPPGMTYSDIPVRQPYPFNEEDLNLENYEQAAEAIGGDQVSTRLFWDTQDSPFLK